MNFEFITINQTNLGNSIASHFGKPLHHANVTRFADGETQVTFDNPDFWRNKHATIIQTTYPNPQEQILHVAFLAHELTNAGCSKITAVIPYFGYSRQEKSHIPGKYGHAQVIARLLQDAGVNQIITIEAHTPLLKDFFTIPFHSLSLTDQFTHHIQQHIDVSQGVSLVAVDNGAYKRTQAIADKLSCSIIQCTKERYAQDQTRVLSMSGEFNVPTAIIVDDIIDTGGTALHICKELQQKGIEHIFGYFAHPVFSAHALHNAQESMFKKVFVANTIPLKNLQPYNKIELFDISSILIEQIKNL